MTREEAADILIKHQRKETRGKPNTEILRGFHHDTRIIDAIIEASKHNLIPEEKTYPIGYQENYDERKAYADGWNECREEMIYRINKGIIG